MSATIVVPAEGKPLEITVSALPWSGTQADLLSNVNRWRGQLKLPAIETSQLAANTQEAKAGDLPMTICPSRRQFGGGMTPPFAGRGPCPASDRRSLVARRQEQRRPICHQAIRPSMPPRPLPVCLPISSVATRRPVRLCLCLIPPNSRPHPAGKTWAPVVCAKLPSQLATLPTAEVSLINFPTTEGSMIADPLANTNRWRREVGLPDLKQEELAKANELIEIDGKPAMLVLRDSRCIASEPVAIQPRDAGCDGQAGRPTLVH